MEETIILSCDIGLTGYFTLNKINKDNQLEILNIIKINTVNKNVLLKRKKEFVIDVSDSFVKTEIDFLTNLHSLNLHLSGFDFTKNKLIMCSEQTTPRPFYSNSSVASLASSSATINSIFDGVKICRKGEEKINIDRIVIPPKTWKDELQLSNDKKASINLYNYLIGCDEIVNKTKNNNIKNHNLVESILIAYFIKNIKPNIKV